MTTEQTTYAFRNSEPAAVTQLVAIQGYLDDLTMRRIRELDLPPDGVCWEVGAGAGSIAAWLADEVVPDGHVVATDIDTSRLAPAANLDIYRADVSTDPVPPGGPFNLIHARLVTQHLASRRNLVPQLAAALKPGGWLMLGEFHCQTPPRVVTAPTDADAELFGRFLQTLLGVLTARGVDMTWATQVHRAMTHAGMTGVDSISYAESWTGGSAGCRLYEANSIQQEEGLLRAGLTAAEMNRVRAMTRDPAFTVLSYPFVSTRGQRAPELHVVTPIGTSGRDPARNDGAPSDAVGDER
jgi:SAM-dependent methyltransferase